jgi:hypothetical protein
LRWRGCGRRVAVAVGASGSWKKLLVVAVAGRGQRRSKGALWPGRPRRRRRARRPATTTATCVARACVGSRAPCLCKLSLDAVKKKSDLSFCAGSRPPAKSRRSRRSYRHGHPCMNASGHPLLIWALLTASCYTPRRAVKKRTRRKRFFLPRVVGSLAS